MANDDGVSKITSQSGTMACLEITGYHQFRIINQ